MKYAIVLIGTCIALVLCFWNTHATPIQRWDEKTNISVVGELIRSGNPLTLTLDNSPFFEKPPLWYWSSALFVKVFGNHLWTYRIISSLSGVLLFLIGGLYVAQHGCATAVLLYLFTLVSSWQLFLTNPGGYFSTHTRSADLDGLFMVLTVLSWIASIGVVQRKRYMVIFLVLFTSLGILTKGPLALGLLIIAASWAVLTRDTTLAWSMCAATVGIGCLVSPWYLWMISYYGMPFFDTHIGYHLISRVLSPLEGHSASWYYPTRLLSDLRLSLTGIFIPVGIYFYIKNKKSVHEYKIYSLIALILLYICVLSIMQTKLPWYILPIYPLIALLTALLSTHDNGHSPHVQKRKYPHT